MRGRRPQPSDLKLLRGNPGRRPLNAAEPKHPTIDAVVPDVIAGDAVAAAEWQRVIAQLQTTGHVTTMDRAMLIAYCECWSSYARLVQQSRGEPLVKATASGYPIPNPTIGMVNKACALLVKLASELGITPSSRSRIVANPPMPTPSDSTFDAFQRQRDPQRPRRP
jgi:P27 family predicted phage terminase small subunit